jgi:mRNA interferase MazF
MPGAGLLRGRVYGAKLSHIGREKYFLVVSNNRRNQQLETVLAARLTTTPKPRLSSIVELDDREIFSGRVVCDDIVELWPDEVTRDLGALTPGAMVRVEDGLRAALDL